MIKKALFLFSTLMILTASCSGEDNNSVIDDDNNGTEVPDEDGDNDKNSNSMILTIGNTTLTATLADNSSVDALVEDLKKGPISVDMRDYGNMEKVGDLGKSYPRNDVSITTEPGDIILYQGSALVIYYAPNSWSFTRLGKIDDITQQELKDVLGNGDVTVTLSLSDED
nr:cyclophilin-like fold protein [uncultured Carboxylicivirga sp.]